MRFASLGTALLLALTGCTAQPLAPSGGAPAFETKLINTLSLGSQVASQLNLTPNDQLNFTNQFVQSNATASFPIASQVGAGVAVANNATAQDIANYVTQNQNQSQLVL